MWFIGVQVEQEMSAPPPKKKRGSAPDKSFINFVSAAYLSLGRTLYFRRIYVESSEHNSTCISEHILSCYFDLFFDIPAYP